MQNKVHNSVGDINWLKIHWFWLMRGYKRAREVLLLAHVKPKKQRFGRSSDLFLVRKRNTQMFHN